MSNKSSTVLIIDDNECVCTLLERILYKRHIILTADCASTGLSLLREHDVQIVLLDIRLPDINGIEVLNKIKRQSPHIEVIMISGVKEAEVVARAFELGAYHFMTKTFHYDEVNALVGKCLEHIQERPMN